MRQVQTEIVAQTRGMSCHPITRQVCDWVAASGITTGMLTLFIRHTSASLAIQENADPDVRLDLVDALSRLAPADGGLYRHMTEGPDDMPAHVKAALTDVSLSIPVAKGMPCLGTWQGIYILEHRAYGHARSVVCHLMGD